MLQRNADGAQFSSGEAPPQNGSTPSHNVHVIGRSVAFHSLLDEIRAVAGRDSSVVIHGETGSGKEMVARRIHELSLRSREVFIPVDCTILTGELFESQLFGHVKGAFTGAHSESLGFFRAADKGTIFLDEIAEIPPALQAKLLRVLQENEVMPLGSTKSHPVDIRVLCATHRDLFKMVEQGEFREDLFYRLNVVQLEVPPLRDRRDDILPLADYFLERQANLYGESPKELDPQTRELLVQYEWPGNVRELANAMERAYIMAHDDRIRLRNLPAAVRRQKKGAKKRRHGPPTLDEVTRDTIIEALNYTRGRKMAAAKVLRIDHRRLSRLMNKYDISPSYA